MTFSILKYGIEMFSFESESFKGAIHGFFTRKGGVSSGEFSSLNLGGLSGDKRENVIENRRRVFDGVGADVNTLFDVWQVHSNSTVFAESPRGLTEPHQKADSIFTDKPNVTLMMRFADCVPIILYDPTRRIVGLIHAGWIGTVNQIVTEAMQSVCRHYGTKPDSFIAGIGPSIGPDHYIIGQDVYQKALPVFRDKEGEIFFQDNGNLHFDLWKANEYLLHKAGVKTVLQANICTACDTENWYSHRTENGKTGRFGAILRLEE